MFDGRTSDICTQMNNAESLNNLQESKGDSPREIHLSGIRSNGGAAEIMELVSTLPAFPKG
jgi:hypothetical protein